MNMVVQQLNPYACKTYLLTASGSTKAVLIDPVLEHVHDYLNLLKARELKLKYVIDTHTHADHISGCAALQDLTDCDYIMHNRAPAHCPSIRVDDRTNLELLPGVFFEFMTTPGHTADSVSILAGKNLFSGDALFLDEGGAGLDDLPGGEPGVHWDSLEKIKALPGECIVYPAHDYRRRIPSTLAQQKKRNPHLKFKQRDAFVQYVENLKLGPAEWMKDVLQSNYACARDPQAAWIPVDMPACEIQGTAEPGINTIQVQAIGPEELKEKIQSASPPVLIDVRQPEELSGELGFIDGSINIPLLNLTRKHFNLKQYREGEVFLICRSGHRANTAAQIMLKAGLENIKVLEGGMLGWRRMNTASSARK